MLVTNIGIVGRWASLLPPVSVFLIPFVHQGLSNFIFPIFKFDMSFYCFISLWNYVSNQNKIVITYAITCQSHRFTSLPRSIFSFPKLKFSKVLWRGAFSLFGPHLSSQTKFLCIISTPILLWESFSLWHISFACFQLIMGRCSLVLLPKKWERLHGLSFFECPIVEN